MFGRFYLYRCKENIPWKKNRRSSSASFHLHKVKGYFRVKFVRVCVAIVTEYVSSKLPHIEQIIKIHETLYKRDREPKNTTFKTLRVFFTCF